VSGNVRGAPSGRWPPFTPGDEGALGEPGRALATAALDDQGQRRRPDALSHYRFRLKGAVWHLGAIP
jgi:hypothetical protein